MIRARFKNSSEDSAQSLVCARQILQYAKAEADKILKNSKSKAAKKINLARKRVYKRAFNLATKRAEHQLGQLLEELRNEYSGAIEKLQLECLDLSISIAEEVIGRSVSQDSSALVEKIRRGVRQMAGTQPISLILNQSNHQEVKDSLLNHGLERIGEISTSEQITPGNAVLRSSAGAVELSWQEHLRLLETRLRKRLMDRG